MRNVIDHGIEAAEQRVAAGKPAVGHVLLRFRALEDGLLGVELEDDGRGLDLEAIALGCVARGVRTVAEVDAMSPAEQARLILLPGVTAAQGLTHISGRGVGMDVVRNCVRKLGGEVDITTCPGEGTTFRFVIPANAAADDRDERRTSRQPE